MQEVERLTGMSIGLSDLNFFLSDSSRFKVRSIRQSHNAPVCRLMKSCPTGLKKCIQTENWKALKSADHPNGFVHTCHAGVSDFIVPLEVRGRHAGIMFLGETVTANEKNLRSLRGRLAAEHQLPRKDVDEAFAKMPRSSLKTLRSTGRILGVARGFIEQVEQVLSLGREYNLFLEENARTAAEAVRLGKMPFRRLRELRSRLEGQAAEPIRKALDFIESGYSKSIKHSEIARQAGLSVSHFSREFHRQTGRTFRSVLLETRLSVGLFLIKKYHATTGEAAYLVGYADEISFRRAFKKLSGMSARMFMKKYPRAFDIIET